MTMWRSLTTWAALRRHELAKNTPPPGVNQAPAGNSHRAWMQSRHGGGTDAIPPGLRRRQDYGKVGVWTSEAGGAGPTCFTTDGFIHAALGAAHTSAGRTLGRSLPVDQKQC